MIARHRRSSEAPAGRPASPRVRKPSTSAACAALVALAITFAGCGESKEEQAKKTVCSAKSDIQTRVKTLEGLSPTVASLPQIKDEASEIATDVKKIVGAEKELAPARKAEVQQATQAFEQHVSSALSELSSSLSLSGVESQLQAALKQLKSGYEQALAPISCS